MVTGRIFEARRHRHLTFKYELPHQTYFCKVIENPIDARGEIEGYDLVKELYAVPIRRGVTQDKRGRFIISYDYIPSIGKDRGLLLDLINSSYSGSLSKLNRFITQLLDHYSSVISNTAIAKPLSQRKTALYEDRIAAGGRIDAFYHGAVNKVLSAETSNLVIGNCGAYRFLINHCEFEFDWNKCIDSLRRYFGSLDSVWTAITQGDPTAVNIGYPLVWVDFETAGYNAILGEFANYCWDTYVFGGYLVPQYGRKALRDHPRTFDLMTRNAPVITRFSINESSRNIIINYEFLPPEPRRILLNQYFAVLMKPLVESRFGKGWQTEFAKYLSLRIIGIYNIFSMKETDTLFLIAKLAEAQSDSFDFFTFFGIQRQGN